MTSAAPSTSLQKALPIPDIKESESGSSMGSVEYEDWMSLEDLLDSIQNRNAWTFDLDDETLDKIAENPDMMSPRVLETLEKWSRWSCDRARVAARIMFATRYAKVIVFWPASSQAQPPSSTGVSGVSHCSHAVTPKTLLAYMDDTKYSKRSYLNKNLVPYPGSRINHEVQSSIGRTVSTSNVFGASAGHGVRLGEEVTWNAPAGYTFEERFGHDYALVYSVQSSMDYEKTSQTRHIQWGWDITRCRGPRMYGFILYNVVKLEDLFDISQPGYSSAGEGRITVVDRWKHLTDGDDIFVDTDETLPYASWAVRDDITVDIVGQIAAGLLFDRYRPEPDADPVTRYEA